MLVVNVGTLACTCSVLLFISKQRKWRNLKKSSHIIFTTKKKMAHRLRVEFRKKLTRENLGKPFPPIDWKVKSIFLSELEVGSFSFYDYCR
jgi:hypothetical protein